MAIRSYNVPLPGLGPEIINPFNSFEQPVVEKLVRYLADPTTPPLLTNNEEDLIINYDPTYFDAISQAYVPKDVLDRLHSGSMTHDDIKRNMQIGRGIIRREKSDMYADRIITATYAVDACRSVFRVANGGNFVPIEHDETVEDVTRRVGDYVTDLLVAGRDRRVLRNAAMHRLTDTIRTKFDTDPDAAKVLTGLAGQNVSKKVGLYIAQLATVSKGFTRMSAASKRKLNEYMLTRPLEFQDKPDLITLLAAKANK